MRMGMAGNDRAVCRKVIDVLVAVLIPETGASGAFHKYRGASANGFEGTGGTVDAPDNMLKSFLV
ncbi:hypothetical protein D3C81_2112690 [compost metagenome]